MRSSAGKITSGLGVLSLSTTLPVAASGQGVPVADGTALIQHGLEIAQMATLTGARELEAEKKRWITELRQDQPAALDVTLAMMTGQAPFIGDLEVLPGAEAAVLYAVEDSNPYAARLFGEGISDREGKFTATVTYRFKPARETALDLVWQNPTGFLATDYRITAETLTAPES